MILAQLRRDTADLHASLETALPLGTLDLTRESYVRVLQGFRGYFAAWEPAARRAAPAELSSFLMERARTELLDRDLASLDAVPARELAEDLPAMLSTAQLLGSMYVLEGSRLGGQSMVRGLEERLGLTPQHGLAFFYGFGPHTGSQWKAFCAVVEERIDAGHAEEAIASARATFLSFHDWMVASGVAGQDRITAVQT